jgi:hypothetical protein
MLCLCGLESVLRFLFSLKLPPHNLDRVNPPATPQRHRTRNNNNHDKEKTKIDERCSQSWFSYVLTGYVIEKCPANKAW